ncbi:MAG: hypothetical protein QOJ91_2566 [Sphingomonadales bacterium]|jgi:glycosyltransferase involved in cell wall biosynthesis|nr:hypothetical protein [Sphingomonadales bacterium]
MRILLYNFVQPGEPGAGGAGTYNTNLAKALESQNHEVITLSAGVAYSAFRRKVFLRPSRASSSRVEVVNSPVPAPARFNFAAPLVYTRSRALDAVPGQLRDRYGDIEAFHFNSNEGLTRSFFVELRRVFPNAKILYAAHNYSLVCPIVTLWYDDRQTCADFLGGRSCTTCQKAVHSADATRLGRKLGVRSDALPVRGVRPDAVSGPVELLRRLAKAAMLFLRAGRARAPSVAQAAGAAHYAEYRGANIRLCEHIFDQVLAVSRRTRDILIRDGIPEAKLSVSYIGTANRRAPVAPSGAASARPYLHLAYLGYMSREKGLRFLLDSLEHMPAPLASRLSLTVAAENTSADNHRSITALRRRLRAVTYVDGYAPGELDGLLKEVDLGIVPVLWEDNLPQIAIELVARGIPILVSDRGGAQELFSNDRFVFKSGSHSELNRVLTDILRGDLTLESFWNGDLRLYSMLEHLRDLEKYYGRKLCE